MMKTSHLALLALVSLLSPALVAADKRPGAAASIQSVQFKGVPAPGASVTAVVRVALDKDYHVHSNEPSEKQFIATELNVELPPGFSASKPVYPQGKKEKVAGLYKPLSVYAGTFEISLPLTIADGTVLPAVLPATLSYQACQGPTCFPPQKLKFEIKVPTPPRP
jgi:hypothetical protein